jgi:hypothetical protein
VIQGEGRAKQVPYTAACYACVEDHGTTHTTFVQIYPTLADRDAPRDAEPRQRGGGEVGAVWRASRNGS